MEPRLQKRLEEIIADRRELYNDTVYRYDARIAQVPAVVLTALFGWQPRPFFQAGADERTPPLAALSAPTKPPE